MRDEMDILREVSSIAAGHGSIALSELVGRKLNLEMPALSLMSAKDAVAKMKTDEIVLSVSCNILSGLKGEIVFVLNEKSAFKLIDLCYREQTLDKKSGMFTEMGLSVIKEIGNIIVSSYVGALSMILKTIVIPSTPTLVSGTLHRVMSMVVSGYQPNGCFLFVEAQFIEPKEKITGTFFLILDKQAMEHIRKACKQILKSLQ